MTIIGDEIPLISEKQSLSKVLLNDENNELSDEIQTSGIKIVN